MCFCAIMSSYREEMKMTTYSTSLSTISGYLLSQIRNRMNLNQRDMAKLFDMTQGAYGNMERGDANINAEFIFMLCSLVGIKASDFFGLLEEIMVELNNMKTDKRGNDIKIEIVSSNELSSISLAYKVFKTLTDRENISESELEFFKEDLLKKTNGKLLLSTEDIEHFLSDDIISKVTVLSKIRLSKDEIKEIIKIKSEEIEESVKISESGLMATSAISSSALIGTAVAGPLGFLVGSLFNSYKKSKEK